MSSTLEPDSCALQWDGVSLRLPILLEDLQHALMIHTSISPAGRTHPGILSILMIRSEKPRIQPRN